MISRLSVFDSHVFFVPSAREVSVSANDAPAVVSGPAPAASGVDDVARRRRPRATMDGDALASRYRTWVDDGQPCAADDAANPCPAQPAAQVASIVLYTDPQRFDESNEGWAGVSPSRAGNGDATARA